MIQPIEYNVLVKPDAVQDKTPGGLMKPDTVVSREKYRRNKGTIVAISPMAFRFEDWPKNREKPAEGDAVYFRINDGTEVMDGEDELLLVPDRSILAVVK